MAQFLSPDGNVWCSFSSSYRFCAAGYSATGKQPPQREATLDNRGNVTFCYVRVPSFSQICFQNWGIGAPVLHYGQTNERSGVRCTSARNGVTCVLVSGPGRGRGFRINGNEAVRIGPRALNGSISLVATGGRIRGYTASLVGTFGTRHPDLDDLTVGVAKRRHGVTQIHAWTLRLPARAFKLDRTKASLSVDYRLGRGGADGRFHFTFSGRLRHRSLPCGAQHYLVKGTLRGTIRLRIHDRFFRTITVRRMRGQVTDTPSPPAHCAPRPCSASSYSLDGFRPSTPGDRVLSLDASTPASRRGAFTITTFLVNGPTAGTPFSSVYHEMSEAGRRSFFTPNAALTAATVKTPGGALSGSLSFGAPGAPTSFRESCRKGHVQFADRPVRVTGGTITARFDSIGKVAFDSGLNAGTLTLSHQTRTR